MATKIIVRATRAFIGPAFALLAGGDAAVAATIDSFFPAPPPNVRVEHVQGILQVYGIGMHLGGFQLETAHGPVDFYVSTSMKIDGVLVRCLIAPHGTFRASPEICPDWPAKIVLGRSVVKVAYWDAWRPDIARTVHVSNSMTTVSPRARDASELDVRIDVHPERLL